MWLGVVGRFTVVAQTPDQALGDDADNIAGHHVGQYANIEQAGDGTKRRVGVQRGVYLMPGHRRPEGHFCGFGIAHLADQNNVRILAHH